MGKWGDWGGGATRQKIDGRGERFFFLRFLVCFFFNKEPGMSQIHFTGRQRNVVELSYRSARCAKECTWRCAATRPPVLFTKRLNVWHALRFKSGSTRRVFVFLSLSYSQSKSLDGRTREAQSCEVKSHGHDVCAHAHTHARTHAPVRLRHISNRIPRLCSCSHLEPVS